MDGRERGDDDDDSMGVMIRCSRAAPMCDVLMMQCCEIPRSPVFVYERYFVA